MIGPMATQRFPTEKYVRQIRSIETELSRWHALYDDWLATADGHPNTDALWMRRAMLEQFVKELVSVENRLRRFPRLS